MMFGIFIRNAEKVHGKLYDYSLIDYKNTKIDVDIKCKIHGIFQQNYDSHVRKGCGCPKCRISKGEKAIEKILNNLDIKYITQKTFDDCRNKNKLPFDFYIQEYNVCIEFDGEQHYRVHKIWGYEKFMNTQLNDKIKTDYCEKNNIHLIRIKFDEKLEDFTQKIKTFFSK